MYKVSLYKNAYSTAKIKDVDLISFLTTSHFKTVVESIRATTSNEDKNKLKQQLYAVTVSGLFGECRRQGHLIEHSGLLCLDVDEFNGEQTPQSVKELFQSMDETLFVGYSCSGRVFAILKIRPEEHLNAFLSLEEILMDNFNITVDKQCKDTTRLRYASYSEDFYYNEHAAVYKVPKWFRDRQTEATKLKLSKQSQMTFDNSNDAAKAFLSECNRYQNECIQGNRDNWCILRAHRANTLYKLNKQDATDVLSKFNHLAPQKMIDKCVNSAFG